MPWYSLPSSPSWSAAGLALADRAEVVARQAVECHLPDLAMRWWNSQYTSPCVSAAQNSRGGSSSPPSGHLHCRGLSLANVSCRILGASGGGGGGGLGGRGGGVGGFGTPLARRRLRMYGLSGCCLALRAGSLSRCTLPSTLQRVM